MSRSQVLNSRNIMSLFGISHMTVYNWRAGSSGRDPLPVNLTTQGGVEFPVTRIKAWARKHQIPMTMDPESLVGVGVGTRGPKPKTWTAPAVKLKSAKVSKVAKVPPVAP